MLMVITIYRELSRRFASSRPVTRVSRKTSPSSTRRLRLRTPLDSGDAADLSWRSMKNFYLSFAVPLTLVACAPTPLPAYLQFPLMIQVPSAGHESAKAQIVTLTDDLNKRCGKLVIAGVTETSQPIHVVWLQQADYHDGGVSDLVPEEKGVAILIVTDGLLPEEEDSGHLSDCEVGYLWLHWIATLAGLHPQYSDTSKITYSHPNCPGYIPDIVGETVVELAAIGMCASQ